MAEIITNLIPESLGDNIEELLRTKVTGDSTIARTRSKELIESMKEAKALFCSIFGLSSQLVNNVLQIYNSTDQVFGARRVHSDGVKAYVLGLGSCPDQNAGTIAIKGPGEKHYFDESYENITKWSLNTNLRNDIELVQAPRLGALVLSSDELHCMPHLPHMSKRLLICSFEKLQTN